MSHRLWEVATSRQHGFSLLELVVVMLIVGLVMTLVPPAFTKSSANYLKSSARTLASALRYTRSRAINSNRQTVLVFDMAQRQYHYPDRAVKALPETLGIRFTSDRGEYMVENHSSAIRFYPDGGSSGGKVVLYVHGDGDGDRTTGREITISVSWLTGAVRVE